MKCMTFPDNNQTKCKLLLKVVPYLILLLSCFQRTKNMIIRCFFNWNSYFRDPWDTAAAPLGNDNKGILWL